MPKSKKPRQSRSRSINPAAQVTRIVELCGKIVNPALPDDLAAVLEEDLSLIVENCLHSQKDTVLNEALATLVALGPRSPGADAADFFAETLEDAATAMAVLTTSRDGSQGVGVSSLFAIPVITVNSGGLGQGFRLNYGHGRIDDFARSFKQFGMVDPDATVVVPAYLYHPSELDNWTWSKTRGVMTEALGALSMPAGLRAPRELLGQSGWPRASADNKSLPTLDLRYLLVATLTVDPSRMPFQPKFPDMVEQPEPGPEAIEDAAVTEYFDSVHAWESHVRPIVSELLGAGSTLAYLGDPEPLFTGIRRGLTAYRSVGADYKLLAALRDAGMLAAETRATAAKYYVNDRSDIVQIRVSVFREDGSLLLGTTHELWPFEDPDDVLLDIADTLERMHFSGVSVEPVPVRIADPGQPAFWTPSGLALPGDARKLARLQGGTATGQDQPKLH